MVPSRVAFAQSSKERSKRAEPRWDVTLYPSAFRLWEQSRAGELGEPPFCPRSAAINVCSPA